MLSRVAENVYWMARHIERAEDTARLISVNANLLLDMPRRTAFGWEPLIFITGGEALFNQSYPTPDELNVIKFLIGDRDNSGSILSSLSYARENLRTTRDIVPRETWEQINDLYLYVKDRLEMGISRRGRYEFLKKIVQGTQQITGLLAGTMTHGQAYDFVKTGRNLERADMTTRILDVRSANLLLGQGPVQEQSQSQGQSQEQDPGELNPFDSIQWMSVLKSLSAYQMYRQRVRLRVRGLDVVRFLLQDALFPRAVQHCLDKVEQSLLRLPRNAEPLAGIARTKKMLNEAQVLELADTGLHEFIDELQIGLGDVHDQLAATYFARQ